MTVRLKSIDSEHMFFEQNGKADKAAYTFYRGEDANFCPTDDSLESDDSIYPYFMRGLVPLEPILDATVPIVAFGSCRRPKSWLKSTGQRCVTTRKFT